MKSRPEGLKMRENLLLSGCGKTTTCTRSPYNKKVALAFPIYMQISLLKMISAFRYTSGELLSRDRGCAFEECIAALSTCN